MGSWIAMNTDHIPEGLRTVAEEPQSPPTQRWEHDVFFWGDSETWGGQRAGAGIRAMLTAKGNEGWELVAVTEGRPRRYTFFFRRPAEN